MLLKRQKPKDRDYDEASYVSCGRDNSADRWAFEAFDRLAVNGAAPDGIYELIGPKIQGNLHRNPHHELVRVVPVSSNLAVHEFNMGLARSFEGFRTMFQADGFKWEGFVFHHPDGRMAKIKRRDYGLSWPPA